MTASSTPPTPTRAPAGLQRRGRAFWRAVAQSYDLTGGEAALLLEAARTMDRLEELRATVAVDGPMSVGSAGQPVIHPAVLEERQQRETLARLLRGLAFPGDDEDTAAAARLGALGARVRWGGRRKGTP